jgi:hypothetical protein
VRSIPGHELRHRICLMNWMLTRAEVRREQAYYGNVRYLCCYQLMKKFKTKYDCSSLLANDHSSECEMVIMITMLTNNLRYHKKQFSKVLLFPEIRKHNYLLTKRFVSLPSQTDLTLTASKLRFLTFLNAHKQDSPHNCIKISIEI